MKVLFWIISVVSIIVGLMLSFICLVVRGFGLAGTAFGEIVHIVGMLSCAVSIIGMVLGIIKLRKGKKKAAIMFALLGLIFSGIIFGGIEIDEMIYAKRLDAQFENRDEQMYGENWNAAPNVEGIPEHYQVLLNKFYVMVRDRWPAEKLMDVGAMAMADHYGEASTDNIGFALVDLNNDHVDELVIGTAVPTEEGATLIFCICTDPENPIYAINSVEGDAYYLHPGDTDGSYKAEIVGENAAWVIAQAEKENTFDFTYREGTMDPAGRVVLDMTPFSRYK